MQKNLDDQAIKAALDGQWDAAVSLNQSILETNPDNIPALNRLARAFAQLGQTADALVNYEQVLRLDKYNTIAKKQCEILKQGSSKAINNNSVTYTEFIEEPGRTKTTSLVRLGDNKVLMCLQPGQLLSVVVKSHWISLTTKQGEYVGSIADNISFRLKQFISGGNEYQVVVRTVNNTDVSVFIRETKKAAAFANTPSF